MSKAKTDTASSAIDGWGQRLRSVMDENGVTNEALADALRVSIGSVNKYLKSGGIGGDLLLRLSDYLAVTPEWLLFGVGHKTPIDETMADYVFPTCDSGRPPIVVEKKAMADLGIPETAIAATAQDSAYRSKIAPGTIILLKTVDLKPLNGALHVIEVDGTRLIRRLFYNPIKKVWTLGVDDDDKQTITMPADEFDTLMEFGNLKIIGEIVASLGKVE